MENQMGTQVHHCDNASSLYPVDPHPRLPNETWNPVSGNYRPVPTQISSASPGHLRSPTYAPIYTPALLNRPQLESLTLRSRPSYLPGSHIGSPSEAGPPHSSAVTRSHWPLLSFGQEPQGAHGTLPHQNDSPGLFKGTVDPSQVGPCAEESNKAKLAIREATD